MKSWINEYMKYAFPFLNIVVFFIPNLSLTNKIIVTLASTMIFFIITTVLLEKRNSSKTKKIDEHHLENTSLQEQIKELNKSVQEYESNNQSLNKQISELNTHIQQANEFIHKRKLFRDHNLIQLQERITQFRGTIIYRYRERVYDELKERTEKIKDETEDIINKEKRAFDNELFYVQSYKDNR